MGRVNANARLNVKKICDAACSLGLQVLPVWSGRDCNNGWYAVKHLEGVVWKTGCAVLRQPKNEAS